MRAYSMALPDAVFSAAKHHLSYHGPDLFGREGLADISPDPLAFQVFHAARTAVSGNHDNGNSIEGRIVGHVFHKLHPGHHRHVDIGEHKIDRFFPEDIEGISAVRCVKHFLNRGTAFGQCFHKDRLHYIRIIDDQNFPFHMFLPHLSGLSSPFFSYSISVFKKYS